MTQSNLVRFLRSSSAILAHSAINRTLWVSGSIAACLSIAHPASAQQPSPEVVSSCLLLASRQLPPAVAGITLRSTEVALISTRPDRVAFYNVRMMLDFAGQPVSMERRCAATPEGEFQLVR